MTRVNELDSLKHLICQHKDSLQGEFSLAVIQKILKTGTKKVDNHDVVVTLNTEPVNVWYTHSALQDAIKLGFVQKLRMFGPHRLKFDGHLFVGSNISSVVDIAKGTTS